MVSGRVRLCGMQLALLLANSANATTASPTVAVPTSSPHTEAPTLAPPFYCNLLSIFIPCDPTDSDGNTVPQTGPNREGVVPMKVDASEASPDAYDQAALVTR